MHPRAHTHSHTHTHTVTQPLQQGHIDLYRLIFIPARWKDRQQYIIRLKAQ